MLLEISGLSSHYGRIQAVRGIDVTVGEGELVALGRYADIVINAKQLFA
jgi:ABC-type branched-subunit amino acid transport system ATPase component